MGHRPCNCSDMSLLQRSQLQVRPIPARVYPWPCHLQETSLRSPLTSPPPTRSTTATRASPTATRTSSTATRAWSTVIRLLWRPTPTHDPRALAVFCRRRARRAPTASRSRYQVEFKPTFSVYIYFIYFRESKLFLFMTCFLRIRESKLLH